MPDFASISRRCSKSRKKTHAEPGAPLFFNVMTFYRLLLCTTAACASSMPAEPSPDAQLDSNAQPHDASPDAPPTPALWVLSNDMTANWLYRIDPVSFAIERRTDLNYPGVLWELAGTSSTLAYAIDRDTDTIVAIDLVAGSIASSVPLSGDMQQNGRGFGTTNGAFVGIFAGTLQTIDVHTGALTQPVTLQYGLMAESLESCGMQLYMASRESGGPRGEKLYAVNRATGTATLRGMIGTTAIDIDSLACFAGRLYGVDADPTLGRSLFEIDPMTGNATILLELPVAGTINGVHATTPTGDGFT